MTGGINYLISRGPQYDIGGAFQQGIQQGQQANALALATQAARSGDYGALTNALLQLGDVRGAMEALKTPEEQRRTRALDARQAEIDKLNRRDIESQITARNKPARTAYDERVAAAAQFGLQPGTPEYNSFVLYNKPAAGDEAFPGQGAEVAGINEMVKTGKITRDQAARYLAGKTVSGPGGELNFITPTDIFPEVAGPAPAPVAPAGNAFGPRDPRYAPSPLQSPVAPPMPVAAPTPTAPAAAPSAGVQLRAGQPKPPTEGNLNAAGFYARANESDAIVSDPENSAAGQSSFQRGLDYLPGGTYLTSPSYQRLDTAKRNFITAVLRKESGASIAPSEFANEERKYFPQPGEGPSIIAQKAQARRTAIEALKLQAGPAVSRESGPQRKTSTGIQWSVE